MQPGSKEHGKKHPIDSLKDHKPVTGAIGDNVVVIDPATLLPIKDSGTSLSAILGDVLYIGTWDANANSPALASGVGTKGHYYVVSVDGNTNLDGETDWKIKDWVIFNGTVWQKVDNTEPAHNELLASSLLWSAAGHTIDTDLDLNTHKAINMTDGSIASDGINLGQISFPKQSAVYHVSDTRGNDSNDGSVSRPVKTRLKAIQLGMIAGFSEIFVKVDMSSGNYTADLTLPDNAIVNMSSYGGFLSIVVAMGDIIMGDGCSLTIDNLTMGLIKEGVGWTVENADVYIENCLIDGIKKSDGTTPSTHIAAVTAGTLDGSTLCTDLKTMKLTSNWTGTIFDGSNLFVSSDGFDASGEKIIKQANGVANDDSAAFGQIGSAISIHAAMPSVHHARYTDAEAVTAMGPKADGNPLNHDRCVSYKVWEESLGESTNATLVFSNKVVKAFVIPTTDDYRVSFSAEVSHSDSGKGTRVRLGLGQFAITAVNQGTKVFTIAGDYTSLFIAGRLMQIQGSTGNDKTYNVVSSVLNVTNTEITVAEVIPSAVVDGDIYACIRVLVETIDKLENDDDYQEVSGFGIVNLPITMSKNIYLCFASDTDTKTAYIRGAVVEMEEVI